MSKIAYIKKQDVNLLHGLNVIDSINSNLSYDERSVVEEKDDCIQPICAATIITMDKKVLTVNKTTKSTGKISPEKDKTLLYVGGHLEKDDVAAGGGF